MFQFRRFPSYTYFIQYMIHEYCSCVFPHSDIPGSADICSSPRLFAACHVLRRLLVPRHSPCALFSLTIFKTWSQNLVLFENYAGSTRVFLHKIVFTLISLLKFSTFASLLCPSKGHPSVALLFFLLCSVFKVHFQGMCPEN